MTTVRYALSKSSPVRLVAFDLLGRRVATAIDDQWPAGAHNVPFEASGLASGIYFYRISAGDFVQTRRMVVLK